MRPAKPSRADRTQTLRMNDLITVREAVSLVQQAVDQHMAAYHPPSFWQRVKIAWTNRHTRRRGQ